MFKDNKIGEIKHTSEYGYVPKNKDNKDKRNVRSPKGGTGENIKRTKLDEE